jgi:hypothetical protein
MFRPKGDGRSQAGYGKWNPGTLLGPLLFLRRGGLAVSSLRERLRSHWNVYFGRNEMRCGGRTKRIQIQLVTAFVQRVLEPLCAKTGVVAGMVFADIRIWVEGRKRLLAGTVVM